MCINNSDGLISVATVKIDDNFYDKEKQNNLYPVVTKQEIDLFINHVKSVEFIEALYTYRVENEKKSTLNGERAVSGDGWIFFTD